MVKTKRKKSILNKFQLLRKLITPQIFDGFNDMNETWCNFLYNEINGSYCHKFFPVYNGENWYPSFYINNEPYFLCTLNEISKDTNKPTKKSKISIVCEGSDDYGMSMHNLDKKVALEIFNNIIHLSRTNELNQKSLFTLGFKKW